MGYRGTAFVSERKVVLDRGLCELSRATPWECQTYLESSRSCQTCRPTRSGAGIPRRGYRSRRYQGAPPVGPAQRHGAASFSGGDDAVGRLAWPGPGHSKPWACCGASFSAEATDPCSCSLSTNEMAVRPPQFKSCFAPCSRIAGRTRENKIRLLGRIFFLCQLV